MAEAEVNGAEARVPSDQVLDLEEEERREGEEKKAREPLIIYKDQIDVSHLSMVMFVLLLTL